MIDDIRYMKIDVCSIYFNVLAAGSMVYAGLSYVCVAFVAHEKVKQHEHWKAFGQHTHKLRSQSD